MKWTKTPLACKSVNYKERSRTKLSFTPEYAYVDNVSVAANL